MSSEQLSAQARSEQILERLRVRLPHLQALMRADIPLQGVRLDSIDWVELLCVVDDDYGVRISEADLKSAQTVGALAQLIAERAAQTGGQA